MVNPYFFSGCASASSGGYMKANAIAIRKSILRMCVFTVCY